MQFILRLEIIEIFAFIFEFKFHLQIRKVKIVNNMNNFNKMADAICVVAEEPPPYLKLIADCWEHIFDRLSIKDILIMGQTCKRMSQMSGYYIREYNPYVEFWMTKAGVQSQDVYVQSDFYRFIGRLIIGPGNESEFHLNVDQFNALKTIVFFDCQITETQIDGMQNVLKNIESIQLNTNKVPGSILEQFSKYCPKLKQLDACDPEAALFLQHFPALECLRYLPFRCMQTDDVKTFFEKHSKLKQFVTSRGFLWENRDILNQTTAHLEFLNVYFNKSDSTVPFNEFIEILKTLHERGFFKKLQLSLPHGIETSSLVHFRNSISTLPQFDRLFVSTHSLVDLPSLTHLRSLRIQELLCGFNCTITEVESLAKNLTNLEHLTFQSANVSAIRPFVRYSKKLQIITIFFLLDSCLNVNALIKERRQLPDACKIVLCVPEKVYLATNARSLSLNLIKILRADPLTYFQYI